MEKHALYPAAPAGYGDPAQVQLGTPAGTREGNTGRAVSKAGAYGGSELGSMLGGAVGPPIIGNVIGNIVGEKVGEKVIVDTGLGDLASKTGDNVAKVIGRDGVEKVGEITLTALGYSESEECVCCPCLPASQVLLVLTIPFYVYNFYKLGLGISYDSGCSTDAPNSSYVYNTTDNVTDVYPCEFGFHYLVVSGAVWITFLPLWICGLFGNCWRQCCCCCCDPIVIFATVVDLFKKCCCECGKFRLCELLWLNHCGFHIIWSFIAVLWLIDVRNATPLFADTVSVTGWEVPGTILDNVLASVILDFLLAGSELFHRLRVIYRRHKSDNVEPEHELKHQLQPNT